MARRAPKGRAGRRRKDDGDDGGSRWLTTYADAITLLMAFFVMLYAMSETDALRFRAVLEGLAAPFGNEAGAAGILPEHDGLEAGPTDAPPDPEDRDVDEFDLEDVASEDGEDEQLEDVPDDELWYDEDDQLYEVQEALAQALRSEGLDTYVEKRRDERGLTVSIASDDVLFALGSTRLDSIGREVIRVVSEILEGFPNPVLVEGHTDDVPLDRAGYTNWNLSTDRAVAVLQLMIEDHELPPDRVGAVGYGEYHPLRDNDTAAGRAVNRRVDIVVLIEESEL